VAIVRTEVSEELRASFIKVTRIGELGTTLAVTSNRRTFAVNEVINLQVPSNAGNLPSGCTTCGLSSGTQLHRVS
jgi:hypothetical protein